jgi:hypothetical protein
MDPLLVVGVIGFLVGAVVGLVLGNRTRRTVVVGAVVVGLAAVAAAWLWNAATTCTGEECGLGPFILFVVLAVAVAGWVVGIPLGAFVRRKLDGGSRHSGAAA